MPHETPVRAGRLGRSGVLQPLRCGRATHTAGTRLPFTTTEYAVVWLERGSATVHHGASSVAVASGAAFQRFPDEPHLVEYHEETVQWYVAVPAPALEVFRLLPGLLVHQRVLPLGGVGGLPRRFATLARQLAQAADEDLPRVYGHLHQFLIDLHRLARGGPHHIALRQAGDLVAEDPLRPPSTAMLAARVGLGHHVFRKAFAQHYGCGPQVYALRLRLRLAQGLLATTNETVASIGARCGWKDPLQFSAVFRRHAGLSPRAWRHREAQGG